MEIELKCTRLLLILFGKPFVNLWRRDGGRVAARRRSAVARRVGEQNECIPPRDKGLASGTGISQLWERATVIGGIWGYTSRHARLEKCGVSEWECESIFGSSTVKICGGQYPMLVKMSARAYALSQALYTPLSRGPPPSWQINSYTIWYGAPAPY